MNQFGRALRLSLFGESHGVGVGITLDGLPAGLPIDPNSVAAAMRRRRPGSSHLVSARQESDEVTFLSGVLDGCATGAPLTLWIPNHDARPADYASSIARPGHADHVNHVASGGHADLRGGGHSSGRLTAPLVAAAAVVAPILDRHGIKTGAHLQQVGPIQGAPNQHSLQAMASAGEQAMPTAHAGLMSSFVKVVETARAHGDSVGGVIEFACEGLPVGLGSPFFDSLESQLAHLLFAVPAVKGVSFGAGFAAPAMPGSQHNDGYAMRDGQIRTLKNDAGGLLGGRSNGERVWGHVAIKPASSIAQAQPSVDLATSQEVQLRLGGRHDPCIAIRAVPVVQACVALVVADALLGQALVWD